jgi:hypothetical protein
MLVATRLKWHSGWGDLPNEGDIIGSETVGFVDEIAESAFELESFGGLDAGGFDGASASRLGYTYGQFRSFFN